MKTKKLQRVKCDHCDNIVEVEQGEERICVTCILLWEDGCAIDNECGDR